MSDLNLQIRKADLTQKANITVSDHQTVADIINAAINEWKLPTDVNYSLVNITQGKTLAPTETLGNSSVEDNNMLELQPVLVAG